MLNELVIRNYALIETLSLTFNRGFTVLTGETGAGKSIIVGAISFLLGSKADTDIIRSGAEETAVSAVIGLEEAPGEALDWLQERGLVPEEEGSTPAELIVRRTLKQNGRQACYIQNTPVTRGDLEALMGLLFDLHGQHAHESLLKKESHRRYLDHFSGLEGDARSYNSLFMSLAEKKRILEAGVRSEREKEQRLELLNYALEEIDQARLRVGEKRELEAESSRLASFEKLAELVNSASDALFDGEYSALGLLRRSHADMEGAFAIDGSLMGIQQRLQDLYYEAEDLSRDFRSYRDNLSSDPDRLEEVEERLKELQKLKKKYAPQAEVGAEEEGILSYREEAAAEIAALNGDEENREQLKGDIKALEKEIYLRSSALTKGRKAGAERLSERIGTIIAALGMAKSRFEVCLLPRGNGEGQANPQKVLGPWGAEDIEFRISANKGEPLKDLSRIASGGELSRVMLAIKTALLPPEGGGASGAPTLIFDEIDTGIGGEVALQVGEYLAKIAETKQIFCVTHLASIAVRADTHLLVEKRDQQNRTVTTVANLHGKGRREEIARMLAGDSAGEAALTHAETLLRRYQKNRGRDGEDFRGK